MPEHTDEMKRLREEEKELVGYINEMADEGRYAFADLDYQRREAGFRKELESVRKQIREIGR